LYQNANIPNLNNSQAIEQREKQKVQQYMNSVQARGNSVNLAGAVYTNSAQNYTQNAMNSAVNASNLRGVSALSQAEKQQAQQRMNQSNPYSG
jgi:hypothetical protein